ncbi:internal (core) protein [Enterobacter phage 01_vB_Eclo_IJM]|nr:internal (core) protein [Enterobacter phage 01_vB_Eclo_IJM]
MNIEGQEPEAPNESFGEMFYKSTGETLDQRADRSTWFGFGGAAEAEVKNSRLAWLSALVRRRTHWMSLEMCLTLPAGITTSGPARS